MNMIGKPPSGGFSICVFEIDFGPFHRLREPGFGRMVKVFY